MVLSIGMLLSFSLLDIYLKAQNISLALRYHVVFCLDM